jgi:cardiolipin synthase
MSTATVFFTLHIILEVIIIVRVILRPNRDPSSRIAWIAVIALFPVWGILAYIYFGEVSIGRKHIGQMRKVLENMPSLARPKPDDSANYLATSSRQFDHLFKLGKSISGFEPVGGNSASLMRDSNAMIDTLVTDIDAAQEHVHLLFYIWLPDNNGCKIVEALKRASGRGIECRAMVDNLGSRSIIKSPHWKSMQECGVHLAKALPFRSLVFKAFTGRVDLRNHRKIVVIDDNITYCGSQNCADPEFLVKAKYAPWVDMVLRFQGPVARQNQHLFSSDWMTYAHEDINHLLRLPISAPEPGFTAQVIGTGPTDRNKAMSQMFVALIASARKTLTITTPYYVPNEAIQSALQSAAYRGVRTIIVFPAKNDSWIVQGASRSYYKELLDAGVVVHEYAEGLLHTKSMTIDNKFAMIGSANLDRRSFDLNYENNILFCDRRIVSEIMARQQEYISHSNECSQETVDAWPAYTRFWNNTIATLGPIL